MGVIFWLSSIPGSDIPGIVPDYVAHSFVYAVLAVAIIFAQESRLNPIRKVPVTIIICLAYALTDEFHQMFVLLRTASMFDIFVDCAASSAIVLLYYAYSRAMWRQGNNA